MDDQREGRGPEPHVWAPPDAGADRAAAVGRSAPPWANEPDVAAGPPPPPWERRRRTRRRWLLGIGAAVILAIPVGFALAGAITGTDEPPVASDGADPDGAAPDEGDGLEDPDELERPLTSPDLDRLEGPDAVFAQLLLDIDDSEQAMFAFQRDVAEVFEGQGFDGDVNELFDALATAGARGAQRLEAARGPLEQPVADVRAESVREVYLEHLDSWVRYMRAVEDDPALLGPNAEDSARYNLSINATADAFARSLDDQLPDDVDPEVAGMAEQLLDRGFRPQGEADV